ncbi:hypothetical protein [Caenimonas soli]|uniref:hypothetical protein n=1 Tax=Caenimonas soli TaxID=2735555 RepID=UPI001553414A|nr:hypothetical protein [Caenimonas soli]NPC54906.1 hypothetical protein [Caenimonas soli]
MSAILESLLDDERRAECRANDGAMAMGRPIIASQLTFHAVRPTSGLHRTIKRVAPARSEHSNAALAATGELW